MPKGITFVLYIDASGSVTRCEETIVNESQRLMRIYSGNNGVSFPGFNLSFSKKRRAILDKCRKSFPNEVAKILMDVPPEFKAFGDLVERCKNSAAGLDDFLTSFRNAASCAELSKKARTLIENLDKEADGTKAKKKEPQVSVFLEIDRPGDYPYPVAHPSTIKFLNCLLFEKMSGRTFAKGGKGSRAKSGRSAFGGEGEIETRFPAVTLPMLGKVILFSMTKDSACQIRYDRIEADAFQVSKSAVQSMKDALATIMRPERKGKTWTAVASSAKSKNDILIAYLESRPETDALFATFFGDSMANAGDLAVARFEEACRTVVSALDGIRAQSVDPHLRVFVLSKADQGRTKVVLSESYRPDEIRRAAENWNEGAKNIPRFEVFIPREKGKPAERVGPRTPFPGCVMRTLNTVWRRGATESAAAPGCTIADVHRVFLRKDRLATDRLLGIAVRRFAGLLVPVAAAQKMRTAGDVSVPARKAALDAVSILGILLYNLSRRKENYMKSASYAIGRILSMVDQLHALYAEEVRKGMPNQLLGNSLMATALERPQTALDLLAQRILPYQAWARIAKGEKAGLARWFLEELGELSAQIKECGVPERTSEMDRAEMLLGYLARTEKSEKEAVA